MTVGAPIRAPQRIAGYGLSNTAPTDGQALLFESDTNLWQPGTASTAPGGSDTQIQYNNNGAFGGSAALVFTATTALTFSAANSTSNTTFKVENTSNAAAASHAIVDIAVGGTTSTGDPQLRLTIPSGTSWHIAAQNLSADRLRIGTGTAPGTNAIITLDPSTTGVANLRAINITPLAATVLDSGGSETYTILRLANVTATIAGTAALTTLWQAVEVLEMTIAQSGGAVTVNKAAGISIEAPLPGASVTLSDTAGLRILNPGTPGGTLTRHHGIYIEDMTRGASDFGLTIEGADTAAIWVSSAADTTGAADGIMFGLSRDTNLYRSAANTLRTDDSLSVGGSSLVVAGTGQIRSVSGVISFSVVSTALTQGSLGSIVAPQTTGTIDDAAGGNLDGCLAVDDNITSRFAVRANGSWKFAAIAGFSIPKYRDPATHTYLPIQLGVPGTYDETVCPLCGEQMTPADVFGMVGDLWYPDGGIHSYAAHLGCTINKTDGFKRLEARVRSLEGQLREYGLTPVPA